MTRPVYLIGSGLTTCLGASVPAHLGPLRDTRTIPAQVVPPASETSWPYHAINGAEGRERLYAFVNIVVAQALLESGLSPEQQRRMPVFVGSSCLDLPIHEHQYAEAEAQNRSETPIRGPGYGTLAARLAQHFGIEGPQYTISTACSSGANALLHARLMLLEGQAEHALVVGIEAFNRLSMQGFGSLLLLSRQEYRPFDRDRSGLILGEGAGAMVIGLSPGAHDRSPLAVCGGASACDPSSPTTSQPDRVADVMSAALDEAEMTIDGLIALKAHGTATTSNDLVEARAMRSLASALPPFTSLKPYVGHTLGACGVIETLMFCAAWRDGFLPGTPGFANLDPEIGLAPVTAARSLSPRGAVLFNFFGFGGNNTSLVLTRS